MKGSYKDLYIITNGMTRSFMMKLEIITSDWGSSL